MNILNLVTTESSFFEKQVKALEENGCTVNTISVPGTANERRPIDYLKFYLKTLRSVSRQYDIIHANYGLTAPAAIAQPTRPVVLSLWGSDLMGPSNWVSKYSTKLCNEVIVMSDEMAYELEQDVNVIPHGVDMSQFKPIPQAKAQKSVGWDSETAHVLFPYDPNREVKNYPLAERVVKMVNSKLSNPIVLEPVYGVDHKDMPLYMNAADALLLTSRREGFPNSVKEAMSCNLPVISTEVGGVRDRLNPVENSYVCTSEPELAARLAEVLVSNERSNGRKYTKDLSLEKMADDIIEVYEQAVK